MVFPSLLFELMNQRCEKEVRKILLICLQGARVTLNKGADKFLRWNFRDSLVFPLLMMHYYFPSKMTFSFCRRNELMEFVDSKMVNLLLQSNPTENLLRVKSNV